MSARSVVLKRRPVGALKPDDFEIIETPIPHPGPGEVVTRTLFLSIDPYMRGRLAETKSYAKPVGIGEVMTVFRLAIWSLAAAAGRPIR
jgi:NADPH-dependent curcumin reductase CurA